MNMQKNATETKKQVTNHNANEDIVAGIRLSDIHSYKEFKRILDQSIMQMDVIKVCLLVQAYKDGRIKGVNE